MKKILATATVAVALMGGYSASALQYSDTDIIFNYMTVGGPAYNGNFNIAAGDGDLIDMGASGYNKNTQMVLSALAAFTFQDLNGTENTFTVQLGGQAFISGSMVPILASFNGEVVGAAYMTLNSTGAIDYRVELTSGAPVILVMASLAAQVGDRVIGIAGVPDGGMTLGLLGCSLLAGSWVCRRLRIGKSTQQVG